MATRQSLRALVVDAVGRTDKTTTINTALAFALKTMCLIYPFDELRTETTTPFNPGDIKVQIPSSVFQIMEARLVDPANPTFTYEMQIMRKREFVKRYPNVAGSPITSRPYHCYRDGTNVYFDCISNGSYQFRMTGLTLDKFETDIYEIHLKHADEVLTAYAVACVYRAIQMYEDASVWDQRFKNLFQVFVNGEEKDVGRDRIAKQWSNPDEFVTAGLIPPWLDPWAGHGAQS